MRYKKVEFNINPEGIFCMNHPLDKWMVSYTMALQDLIKSHRLLVNSFTDQEISINSFYYHKIVLSFVHETWDMVITSMNSNERNSLSKLDGFNELYSELYELINPKTGINMRKLLAKIRNKVFHYPKFLADKENEKIKRIIGELRKDKQRFRFIFDGENGLNTNLEGIENIQLCMLYDTLFENEEKFKEIINKTALVSGKMIMFLQNAVSEYLLNLPTNYYFKILTR